MKSILVVGMGILGRHLARKMQAMGNDVMIVDENEEVIQELSPEFSDCFVGDCTNEGVVRSLGVNNFDCCFVTVDGDFYATLEITSILKEMGASYVVSKASRSRQAKFLKNVGADEVFYPEKEIAEKLAVRYNANNIFDYMELTSEYSMYEIAILPEWVGKTILELNVRQRYGVNIIAIKNGNTLNPSPYGNYVFKEDDHVMVIGHAAEAFDLSAKATKKAD